MCGIALIFNTNTIAPENRRIQAMTKSLHHRGPDGHGIEIRDAAALGHTRLSIVDIAGGAQPMISFCQRYAIIFNGEIYNYQALRKTLEQDGVSFFSQSDTEVILQLFAREGVKCVQRLRGMFSFIIHDSLEESIFMVRDRLGIKPLVYHWDGTTLLAGSEIKAIFASGLVEPQLNKASIRNYFHYQFAISPNTPFDDIFELPAGHQLTLHSGQNAEPIISQYWDIEFPKEGEYETEDEDYWSNQFSATLEDAAQCHTIGEVPIGTYLSGGIDSATTSLLLSRFYKKPLTSFSVHLPDSNLDESEIYRGIAKHLQAECVELTMADDNAEGYLEELIEAMYFLEQPQRMPLDVPFYLLSKMVHGKKYKIVYSGEGADEILAGYDCFRQDYMRLWGNDIKDAGRRKLLYDEQFGLNFSPMHINMIYDLHDKKKQQKVIDTFGTYPAWYDFWQITHDLLPNLFKKEVKEAADANNQMGQLAQQMKEKINGVHQVNQSLYIEIKTRLPGWILWRSDRMSMANSVEGRVPFMDHKLVELAARIPPSLKLRGMNEKYILKKYATPHLPKHPSKYKKQGFYTPIRQWIFSEKNRDALDVFLSDSVLREADFFEPEEVRRLLDEIMSTPEPSTPNEYYHLMKIEWVLMLILTVQILHVQFVKKKAACFSYLESLPSSIRY